MTTVVIAPHQHQWRVLRSTVIASSTSAGITESQGRSFAFEDITPLMHVMHAVSSVPTRGDVAAEIAALRDEISRRGELSRAELARALDVDRRSLSGWASGQIRPALARVEALRLLAHVVREIDAEAPGRTREVLLARRVGGDLLDLLAQGRADLVAQWRRLPVARPAPAATRRREPLYARALASTRRKTPHGTMRRGTPRDASVYEVDPKDAAAFVEREDDRARRARRQ